jgi:hypothetical protein
MDLSVFHTAIVGDEWSPSRFDRFGPGEREGDAHVTSIGG